MCSLTFKLKLLDLGDGVLAAMDLNTVRGTNDMSDRTWHSVTAQLSFEYVWTGWLACSYSIMGVLRPGPNLSVFSSHRECSS